VDWPLFEGVPAVEIERLVSVARRRSFQRGEVVFHDRDPADALHLVRKGRFAVRTMTPLGDVALLSIVGPGEAFGELALLAPERVRSATVEALEPAETFTLSRSHFATLRAQHPEVGHTLALLLAERVRRLDERVLVAHYLDADARVRRAVHELATTTYRDQPDGAIPLTQEQLAAYAGVSRATVNRVLRADEQRGHLTLERGRTIVHDSGAIARRVHGVRRA
jgi:CRP/FNR family cyclic AMP-dependent transcriptional regulator